MSFLNYKGVDAPVRRSQSARRLMAVLALSLFAISLSSCGFWLFPFTKEKIVSYDAVGKDYREVYNMAVASARAIGFNELSPLGDYQDPVTFQANKGFGFDETTFMIFDVSRKGYKGRYAFTLRVTSTRGGDAIIRKFIKTLSKRLVVEEIKGRSYTPIPRTDLRNVNPNPGKTRTEDE